MKGARKTPVSMVARCSVPCAALFRGRLGGLQLAERSGLVKCEQPDHGAVAGSYLLACE